MERTIINVKINTIKELLSLCKISSSIHPNPYYKAIELLNEILDETERERYELDEIILNNSVSKISPIYWWKDVIDSNILQTEEQFKVYMEIFKEYHNEEYLQLQEYGFDNIDTIRDYFGDDYLRN